MKIRRTIGYAGRALLLAAAVGLTALSATPRVRAAEGPLAYTGTNLSGGEFGPLKQGTPRVYGKQYTYPSEKEFAYFAGKGMNVFRLPFKWETLQPTLGAALDATELQRLKTLITAATAKKVVVILDPHNYARYYGKVIGGPDVRNADFADFWSRLATAFRDDPQVWFGLMNEPHDMPTAQWRDAAQAAVTAIRGTEAKNRILIPGNSWSGAHSWVKAGNDLLLSIQDPADNCIYEAHQYLDSDSSGTHPDTVSPTIGSERLRGFVEWCRRNHKRGFLGEFGVGTKETNRAALEDMLASLEKDADVWVGFTWWSAGPWWGDYMFSVEPKGQEDRPQMTWLQPHLQQPRVSAAKR